MPLFFPDGIFNGEVVDPEKLAGEFLRAANVAGRTDQWNWVRDGLGALVYIEGTDMCRVTSSPASIACDLQSVQGAEPLLPDDVGADANIWKIPFKRGFQPIGTGTAAGVLQCQWTTEYPELIFAVLTCQYVRELSSADEGLQPSNRTIRAQVRMQLDGQVLPGSGPFGHALTDLRGTGYAPSTAALSNIFVGVVSAGTHVLQGVAAQADNAAVNSIEEWLISSPVQGACIGTRDLFVLRFARGDVLASG
jgi:hypothetical protein